jgi:periplasmic protein CpxP/Spy
MEKTKLLTIAVIGLLVINFGTLGFLLLKGDNHRPPHGGRPEPKQIIIEKLHLDAEQQKEYAKLIKWHRGEIDKLDGTIRQAKNELYLQLDANVVDVKAKDSLISVINANQKPKRTIGRF